MTYPKISYDTNLCSQGFVVKIINDGPWWDAGIYWFHKNDALDRYEPCDGDKCLKIIKENE